LTAKDKASQNHLPKCTCSGIVSFVFTVCSKSLINGYTPSVRKRYEAEPFTGVHTQENYNKNMQKEVSPHFQMMAA